MKKVFATGFIIIFFILFYLANKFEIIMDNDKTFYKFGVENSYSFNVKSEEFENYKEMTKEINTYTFQDDTYYVNFNKTSSEPFLSSNVEDIKKRLSEAECISTNNYSNYSCDKSLQYPFNREEIIIKDIASMGTKDQDKITIYILEDSNNNIELNQSIAKQYGLQNNAKSLESKELDNINIYVSVMIGVFSYYYLTKSKEIGIHKLNGRTIKSQLLIDFRNNMIYFVYSILVSCLIIYMFNIWNYSTFTITFINTIIVYNIFLIAFAMLMSISLIKFEKINNLINKNIKNKFFNALNFLGLLSIIFLFTSNAFGLIRDYKIYQGRSMAIEKTAERLKKIETLNIVGSRELASRYNALSRFKNTALEFTEEKNQDYYFKEEVIPEILDKVGRYNYPLVHVSSSFLEDKFGKEYLKSLDMGKSHIFINKETIISKEEIKKDVDKYIEYLIYSSVSLSEEEMSQVSLEKNKITQEQVFKEKLDQKLIARKNKESDFQINYKEPGEIEDVIYNPEGLEDSGKGAKDAADEINKDIVYIYYPYKTSLANVKSIYIREKSQKTNDQINQDLIDYFEEEGGKKFFFEEDKGVFINGKRDLYSYVNKVIEKELNHIKDNQAKLIVIGLSMIVLMAFFISYYFRQNIRIYSIYRTLGKNEILSNKKTLRPILISIVGVFVFEILTQALNGNLTKPVINILFNILVFQIFLVFVIMYLIARIKRIFNNTAYYINGGDL